MTVRYAIWSGLVAMPLLLAGTSAEADSIKRTLSWTAEDMLARDYADGDDGTTAAGNGLFDGARRLRDGASKNGDSARTFIQSQQGLFETRWDGLVEDAATLDSFNLWGLDGRGAEWGEDFKPLEWVKVNAPNGWETGFFDAGPDGLGWFQNDDPSQGNFVDFNTPLFPWFSSPDGGGIPLGGNGLDELEFSVTIKFDEDDAFFGQDTFGAPNELDGELTTYFGGTLSSGDLFEGNLTLEAVPQPSTIALLGMSLLGLSVVARRRRR